MFIQHNKICKTYTLINGDRKVDVFIYIYIYMFEYRSLKTLLLASCVFGDNGVPRTHTDPCGLVCQHQKFKNRFKSICPTQKITRICSRGLLASQNP